MLPLGVGRTDFPEVITGIDLVYMFSCFIQYVYSLLLHLRADVQAGTRPTANWHYVIPWHFLRF